MKKSYVLVLIVMLLDAVHGNAQNKVLKPRLDILKIIDRSLKNATEQYKVLIKNVEPDKFPETFTKGYVKQKAPNGWVTGFYPGTLLYLYEATKDTVMYNAALQKLPLLEKQKYISSHDIGFMINCSFGNAYTIDPKTEYKETIITSAQTLASRLNPTVGCIRSWDSQKDFLVIIDNMMNLELLTLASKLSGDSSYKKTAITHAETTLKNHFRPDYSSYHLVVYDPLTGAVIRKKTVQGAGDETAWARGQAWALYGYTMMYREIGDRRYLEQAKGIAKFILDNPNLPKDKVPYWDFSAPDIPNALRDASAGALYASALIELAGFVDTKSAKEYIHVAETIIKTLSGPEYTAAIGNNGGFLLKHGVGSLPDNSFVDEPLAYADYYYVEAMLRYKNLGKGKDH